MNSSRSHLRFMLSILLHMWSGPFALWSTYPFDWKRTIQFHPPVSSPPIRGLPFILPVLCLPLCWFLQEHFYSTLSVSMPHVYSTTECLLRCSELLCTSLTPTQLVTFFTSLMLHTTCADGIQSSCDWNSYRSCSESILQRYWLSWWSTTFCILWIYSGK